MYIGAGMTLAGAALFYQSLSIFIYTCVFFLITHLFVVLTRSRLCGELSVMNTKCISGRRQPLAAEARRSRKQEWTRTG